MAMPFCKGICAFISVLHPGSAPLMGGAHYQCTAPSVCSPFEALDLTMYWTSLDGRYAFICVLYLPSPLPLGSLVIQKNQIQFSFCISWLMEMAIHPAVFSILSRIWFVSSIPLHFHSLSTPFSPRITILNLRNVHHIYLPFMRLCWQFYFKTKDSSNHQGHWEGREDMTRRNQVLGQS